VTPASGPTTTRSEYIALLREHLLAMLAQGARELHCADLDFADWPWNEAPVIEALTAWARPHHRLVLLAHGYDEVHRRHPRFVQWRRTWGHLVHAWSPLELTPADHPSLLLGGTQMVEVLDRASWRARLNVEPSDVARAKQALDALLQRSEPAFAATTLGL